MYFFFDYMNIFRFFNETKFLLMERNHKQTMSDIMLFDPLPFIGDILELGS